MIEENMDLDAILEKLIREEKRKDLEEKIRRSLLLINLQNFLDDWGRLMYLNLLRAREVFEARYIMTRNKEPITIHELRDICLSSRSPWEVDELVSIHELRDMSGGKLRHATVDDYKQWLAGYLKRGGRAISYYDRPFDPTDWYVAEEDFEIVPLYRANAIKIIVPANVRFLGGELGYNELYLMDGFRILGAFGKAPVYSNIKFKEDY